MKLLGYETWYEYEKVSFRFFFFLSKSKLQLGETMCFTVLKFAPDGSTS
jgi:hypothetical protein